MNWRKSKTLMAVVICLVVKSLLAASDPNLSHDQIFTGAVSDNWNMANNWYDLTVPDGNHYVYVGCPEYPNKSATIYSGTSALSRRMWIGGGKAAGSLTVQAGATLSCDVRLEVGSYDYHFDNAYLPFDITDDNEWLVGGTGTLTVNGTISSAGSIEIGSRGKGTLYLNSGGLIEVTDFGGDIYIGKEYHYIRTDDDTEVYHADGATLSIADNFMMATHHNQNDSFYKFVGGGVVTTGTPTDFSNLGNFNNWNGIVWVDGGTATINITSPPGYGCALFINYSPFGEDTAMSGEGNDVPVLKLSGNDPLLKVNGLMAFTGAKLDVSELTIVPNTWITVVEANSMAEHTDWQFATGAHDSNDLTFAASVDANLWSMRILSDKVEVMYIPEPAVLALLAFGAAELLRRRRRK